MITTTHVAAASLIAVLTMQSGMDQPEQLATVAACSFASHLVLDIIPHGYLVHPRSLFRKLVPTLVELGPGILILIAAIVMFGRPVLFLGAAGFSVLPDVITTLLFKYPKIFSRIPGFVIIHQIHRAIHWFETDNPDGSVSGLFPNRPLLALESIFIVFLVTVLFVVR